MRVEETANSLIEMSRTVLLFVMKKSNCKNMKMG